MCIFIQLDVPSPVKVTVSPREQVVSLHSIAKFATVKLLPLSQENDDTVRSVALAKERRHAAAMAAVIRLVIDMVIIYYSLEHKWTTRNRLFYFCFLSECFVARILFSKIVLYTDYDL